MMTEEMGLPREYFEELYERRADPWGFSTRWYEERKRALTMAMLARPRYARVLELGCSTGLLTAQLAPRADVVRAVDISQTAVDIARASLDGIGAHDHVRVERLDVRDGLPTGPFDLVVISEVAYYLTADDVERLGEGTRAALGSEAEVLLCHWRRAVTDYPLRGDAVHTILAGAMGLSRLGRLEDEDLLLELFSTDSWSVATREGLQ